MDDVAIRVTDVSKSFKLPHEKHSSIKGLFINMFRGRRSYENQQALKDISFDVKKGEFFGIIGRNGSGKSTLLKLLAGIYTPDTGQIEVRGRLTPFIELGVGFNPELTGRENVFLNGALLGFSRKEMLAMYDEIVRFAELERFMDQKLKNYSSGMQVRLAFSIAIRTNTDILVLDEVLAVGDAAFQVKCFNYFKELKRRKKTVVFISHDMGAVQDYCDRAILIDGGKIVTEGSPGHAAAKYNELNFSKVSDKKTDKGKKSNRDNRDKIAYIENVWTSHTGKETGIFKPKQEIEVNLKVKMNQSVDHPVAGIIIKDMTGRPIFTTNTKIEKVDMGKYERGDSFFVKVSFSNILNDGTYTVTPAVASEDTHEVYDSHDEAISFDVYGWPFPAALVHPRQKITVTRNK